MNVVLIVIDSLRAQSLALDAEGRPDTPFFDSLCGRALEFRNAHAAECWTLPAHVSMFTGLLPSQHGAHFQNMAYRGWSPTVAELFADSGMHTALMTRCPIFEGSIPGVTRGFMERFTPLATPPALQPAALLVALTKPRLRRQMRDTGFFHPDQRRNLRFLASYVRSLFPADALLLRRALDHMQVQQATRRPYFLFCNLFDVHAPYCPTAGSLLAPVKSVEDLIDNLTGLDALARIGSHQYLHDGFNMPERGRASLLARYHRAIELEDRRLGCFHQEARDRGLLEDTMLIICADHGEAFGEHDLYCHDASVHGTNLRVPLWVQHPRLAPGVVEDVVSMCSLFGLMRDVGLGRSFHETLLCESHRKRHPIALAEHFHYAGSSRIRDFYRRNQATAISAEKKVIARGQSVEHYDLTADPMECAPVAAALDEFLCQEAAESARGRFAREARSVAVAHLGDFRSRFA